MKKRLKKKRKTYMINDVIDGIVDTSIINGNCSLLIKIDHTKVRPGDVRTLYKILRTLNDKHGITAVVTDVAGSIEIDCVDVCKAFDSDLLKLKEREQWYG